MPNVMLHKVVAKQDKHLNVTTTKVPYSKILGFVITKLRTRYGGETKGWLEIDSTKDNEVWLGENYLS